MNHTAWRVAVVGAGPVGLALALHGARLMPQARFTVFDARAATHDVSADPRTLALAQGSVMFLERLRAWPAARAEPIRSVHVSQMAPSPGSPEVLIEAAALGVAQLGAVTSYGALVAPLEAAWLAAVAAEPGRLAMHFGTPVRSIRPEAGQVRIDIEGGESAAAGELAYDLAVVAEGGVFADQARKALVHDYGQTAWVGTLTIEGGAPGRAYERFTRQGPAALLPLPHSAAAAAATAATAADGSASTAATAGELRRAALVWCVQSADDPVRTLDAAQRLAVLNTLFPSEAGRFVSCSPLKDFALGLNAERTLVDGRIVRIGNAAQTLHPVAGQGLNLGLRDAHELVAALRDAVDIEGALKRVEWARAPDRWSMIAATDLLARSFTWPLPGLASARGLGLAALQVAGPLRQAVARQMMFGWR